MKLVNDHLIFIDILCTQDPLYLACSVLSRVLALSFPVLHYPVPLLGCTIWGGGAEVGGGACRLHNNTVCVRPAVGNIQVMGGPNAN